MTVIRMGDVVRSEVTKRGIELTNTNIGKIAESERERHNYGIWAERTVPLINNDNILIDGIRGDAELEVFKSAFGKELKVIGIHASPKIRFQRIIGRNRKDATLTWVAFCQRDLRELKWGIGNAIALCDFMLINESSLEDFQKSAKSLIKTLK